MAVSAERSDTGAIVHRTMVEADVAAVVAIEQSAYTFPWPEGIFRDCIRVGYLCRVLVAPEGIVGYGLVAMGAGEMHLLNICVHAHCRGQGLARRLLVWLLDEAHQTGNGYAFLEVRPSNHAAIQLYDSLGFRQVGVRAGYYQATDGREDAQVYRMDLNVWAMARAKRPLLRGT